MIPRKLHVAADPRRATGRSPIHPSERPESVLVFRSQLLPYSETFIAQQARAMRRYAPVLVGAQRVAGANIDDLHTITLEAGPSTRGRLARRVGRYPTAVLDELRATDPVILHAHFGPDGFKAAPLARRLGVPLVVTFHGYDASQSISPRAGARAWWYGRRLPCLGGAATRVLAVSDYIRGRLIERGLHADDVVTHYIGVDTDRFSPSPLAARTPGLVLAVGRFVEKKGFGDLVEAFGGVAARVGHARLVILGDGPLRAALAARATAAGLPVTMPGAVSSDAVREWLHQAEVVAIPSVTAPNGDTEGLPTILTEAMACGVPVVGTRHAGIPEAVVEGVTGALVGERSPEDLAQALIGLLQDPARASSFGIEARSRAVARFDLQTQTQGLEQIYAGLVQGPSARPRRGPPAPGHLR
jgi:colanic acid/amylovoran biosynthesis glycosyltransferase